MQNILLKLKKLICALWFDVICVNNYREKNEIFLDPEQDFRKAILARIILL